MVATTTHSPEGTSVTAVTDDRLQAIDGETVRALAAPGEVEVGQLDAWWRANNYLTIGQIYLQGNPLLGGPRAPGTINPPLLGPGGPTPGRRRSYPPGPPRSNQTGNRPASLAAPAPAGPRPGA